MRKTKKTIAIILFVVWTCFLTWSLTIGWSMISDVRFAFEGYLTSLTHHVRIDDVLMEVETDTEDWFAVGKAYTPTYTAVGDINGDAGLVFEALDDNISYINKTTGSFRVGRPEQDEAYGRIRITSKYDLDFEKIITLHFKKVYPEEFNAIYWVKTSGWSAKKAYVGVPLYTYTSVKTVGTTEKDYEVIYDPEYFKETDEYTLVPIKVTPEGEKVSLRYVFANGVSGDTIEFEIVEPIKVEKIDEVYVGLNTHDTSIKISATHTINLYADGERIHDDYEIISQNPEAIRITRGDAVQFLKAGKQTLTFRLSNGVSKTVTVDVYNVFEFPTITTPTLNNEGAITCREGKSVEFLCEFPQGVTYQTLSFEYDKEIISLQKSGNKFTVKGLKKGETTVKVILDDGVEHVEKTYRIQVKTNYNPLDFLKKHKENIIGKGFGHIGGFAVLALLAANLARYIKRGKGVKKLLFCFGWGVSVAVLTEIAQSFIPLRSASIVDILLDISGVLFGYLLSCGLVWMRRYFREKEKMQKRRR